ncbi:MFS transporter (plasmid) [Embleya sp. NBC_00888]|uniref:MFS transporter n=1 Tax=Embleya sp. NBC_00888 TaxID=2975960 RepID=UPI002F90DB34|nr:MFS transporter [Embleya sp. NBC_00888]
MAKHYGIWPYLAGAAAARTGDEMSGPALLLAGLAATGSAATGSALLAAVTAAAAFGGPVFGVLLDRSARPGRLLTAALAGYAVALGVILSTLDLVPLAITLLIAVGAGLLGPALSGGWTSQLPRVVPAADLPRATAFDAMTFNLASLTGPALAGVVASAAGADVGVIAALTLICLALPAAWGLPSSRGRAARAGPTTSIGTDLVAGFRVIARTPPLARATAASMWSCVGQGILIAYSPVLGERVLDSPARGTILLSVAAASALATNTLLARRPHTIRPDTVMWCGPLILAGALLVATIGRPVALIAAMLLAGVGEGPQLTALFAIRHREAPAHLRGRIFTTGASLKITAFALGAALTGPLTTPTLALPLHAAAGCQVLAALTFAIRRSPNNRAHPTAEPSPTPAEHTARADPSAPDPRRGDGIGP